MGDTNISANRLVLETVTRGLTFRGDTLRLNTNSLCWLLPALDSDVGTDPEDGCREGRSLGFVVD